MTNLASRPSNTHPLRKSKAPGEAELYALFQVFPNPALLVDNAREQVVMANSAFLQMTTFSLNELIGRPPGHLMNGLPSRPLAGDEVLSLLLDRRNRTPVPVNVQVRALEVTGQWLVLLFEPEEDQRKSLLTRMDQVVDALTEMSRIPDNEPLRHSLDQRLETVQHLLEVSAAGIYRYEPGEVQMWKAAQAGETSLLPDTLPSSDLLRLADLYIWKPGRRVQTELHRSARMNSLSFVASIPLTMHGLLVLVDRSQEPPAHLSQVMSVLSKHFNSFLSNVGLVAALRNRALENKRDLTIWRSMAENAREGILLLAPDFTVTHMNPAAEWMLGYADREVQGQPVENILIGPERLTPALEVACEGIPTHNMGNVSLHRRNGQSFPAHMQIIPVQREGDTLALLIFFSDISEHVEISNRTQQLEQRAVLGEVTAVFAHEVRNPINNISTGLQLLSVKLPGEDPNQENIARLLNDCQRLNHLMESVLNFSRYSEHKFEPVDMESLLQRILDRWRPRMSKVNMTAFFQIEPGTPKVQGDPRSLEQVFTNLISNAVEAMTAKQNGGTLAIRVAPLNLVQGRPQVDISVSDNGPGIPDEIRDRIFEPFVTTKAQGTGLGLAITKRIITAHHGSISVNSFPGGTVFHVFLLAYQGEAE